MARLQLRQLRIIRPWWMAVREGPMGPVSFEPEQIENKTSDVN